MGDRGAALQHVTGAAISIAASLAIGAIPTLGAAASFKGAPSFLLALKAAIGRVWMPVQDWFFLPTLRHGVRLIPVILILQFWAYRAFFSTERLKNSEEEEEVRGYKKMLTEAQMTQSLKWAEDEKEEDLSGEADEKEEEEKKKEDSDEEKKSKGEEEEKKKEPPTAQQLFSILFNTVEDMHVEQFGIPTDDPRYRDTLALFKERIADELREGIANTKLARSGEKYKDGKKITDFENGSKLLKVVDLAKQVKKFFGKDFVDAQAMADAQKYIKELGVTMDRGLGVLWKIFRPYRSEYLMGMVRMFVDTAFGPARWATGYALLDSIKDGSMSLPQLRRLCIVMVIQFAWCISVGWPGRAHMMRVKGKFKLDVRNEVMRALIRQDTEYFDHHETGVLQERLGSDAEELGENLFQIPYETMQSLAIVVGAAIQMGMVDPSFIPICFAPLPCASFLQRFVIKFISECSSGSVTTRHHQLSDADRCCRAVRMRERQRKLSEEAAAQTIEVIKEVRTVREFAMEGKTADRYCSSAAHRANVEIYGESVINCVCFPLFFWVRTAHGLSHTEKEED